MWLPLVLGVTVHVFCAMRRVVTCACVCIVKCESMICACGVHVLRFSIFFKQSNWVFRSGRVKPNRVSLFSSDRVSVTT